MKTPIRSIEESVIRAIAYVIIIVIVGLLTSLTGCSRNQKSSNKMAPVAVRVTHPEIKDISEHITYVGVVHAAEEFTIIARVQGTVTSINVPEGQSINAGDTLLSLSAPELDAVVTRLEADFNYWDQRFAEDKKLELKGAISREQLDASGKAHASSRAALREAQSQLSKTIELAYFEGYVLKHFVDPGQNVMPGQPLLQIGSTELEVQTEVVQENIGKDIGPGSSVFISDYRGNQFRTQVKEVASIATGRSRTFTVMVSLPPTQASGYRVGEAVVVNFVAQSSEQALTVPASAILNRDSSPAIYLVKDSLSILTPVKIGMQQLGFVSVEFDWNGKDYVVVSNVSSLADGTQVYPVYVEGQKL